MRRKPQRAKDDQQAGTVRVGKVREHVAILTQLQQRLTHIRGKKKAGNARFFPNLAM